MNMQKWWSKLFQHPKFPIALQLIILTQSNGACLPLSIVIVIVIIIVRCEEAATMLTGTYIKKHSESAFFRHIEKREKVRPSVKQSSHVRSKKTQNKFSHPDGSLEHPRYMANFPMHRVRTILEISQKSVHTFNRNLANKGKLFRNTNNKILDPFGDFPPPFLPNHQRFRQSVLVSCPI